MSDGIPRTLAALRKEMGELREDVRVLGNAQAQVLHRLDVIRALLRRRRKAAKVRAAARTETP